MTSRRNLLRTASGVVAATVVGGVLMDASPVRAQAGTDESTVSADGSSEIFVTIEGTRQKFKGESIRKGYENSIEGISFAYNVKSPRDSASGQASGKRTHHPVTFVKEWGASTPQFFQALVTNEQLSSVVIDFVRSGGDEHLRAGDQLVAGRVVLADPRLVEAESVEVHQQVEVALEREGGVLAHGVERGEEDAEAQGPVHGATP